MDDCQGFKLLYVFVFLVQYFFPRIQPWIWLSLGFKSLFHEEYRQRYWKPRNCQLITIVDHNEMMDPWLLVAFCVFLLNLADKDLLNSFVGILLKSTTCRSPEFGILFRETPTPSYRTGLTRRSWSCWSLMNIQWDYAVGLDVKSFSRGTLDCLLSDECWVGGHKPVSRPVKTAAPAGPLGGLECFPWTFEGLGDAEGLCFNWFSLLLWSWNH